MFKKKTFTSCWTGKYKLHKIPWHLRRSDACNKTLNKKDETQVNREIKIHVYHKRLTSDPSWEFLRIENKQIKTAPNDSYG